MLLLCCLNCSALCFASVCGFCCSWDIFWKRELWEYTALNNASARAVAQASSGPQHVSSSIKWNGLANGNDTTKKKTPKHKPHRTYCKQKHGKGNVKIPAPSWWAVVTLRRCDSPNCTAPLNFKKVYFQRGAGGRFRTVSCSPAQHPRSVKHLQSGSGGCLSEELSVCNPY